MFSFFRKFLHRESAEQPPASLGLPADTPAAVLGFLQRRDAINDPALSINVLDEGTSAESTQAMRSIPVGSRLGLIVLDDANDSNPYCLITEGPASGMVVHFSHDPEPRIEFTSLDRFEAHLADLRKRGVPIWEADVASPGHPDQDRLAASLHELACEPMDDDIEFLLCLYLPLVREGASHLLPALVANDSFFVREHVAQVIGAARLHGCEEVAERLAKDAHAQVQKAAVRALDALRQGAG